MFDPATMYLHNLVKRAMSDGHVHPVEIANAPKLIDKVYGDGDGHLDLSDLDDIATNVTTEVVDKATNIWDFITSIF